MTPLPLLALLAFSANGPRSDDAKLIEQHLEAWDLPGAESALAAARGLSAKTSSQLAGRIAFEDGRYAAAEKFFEAADSSSESAAWAKFVSDTQKVLSAHHVAESKNVSISYPDGAELLVPWALDVLEAQRAALERILGWAPPGKIRLEFVDSARDLSVLSTLRIDAIRNTGTVAICKFNKLMVLTPRAVLTGYDWMDTIAHEYTHLVISQKSRNTIPIWLHEGLAKYLETSWRGAPGLAMSPSSLTLLGERVRDGRLIPFAKMHPSMALLPTAEDAAVAFSEVFFAVKLIHELGGAQGLSTLLSEAGRGVDERDAIQRVTNMRFPEFEQAWMASLRTLPFPKDAIPLSTNERKQISDAKKPQPSKDEVTFQDFAEVSPKEARRAAHLGELFRTRRRFPAAADSFGRAWKLSQGRYESIGNKYALTLLELKRYAETERVLSETLAAHPGSAMTNTHLGRVRLRARSWDGAFRAYREALAVNPFDPEVQIGLFASARELDETKVTNRAHEAAKKLLGVDEPEFQRIVQRFLGVDDLARAADTLQPVPKQER